MSALKKFFDSLDALPDQDFEGIAAGVDSDQKSSLDDLSGPFLKGELYVPSLVGCSRGEIISVLADWIPEDPALVQRLRALGDPKVFGIGKVDSLPSLVVRGVERPARTGVRAPGLRGGLFSYYADAMSRATDNRFEHLVAFRDAFPGREFPATQGAVWVPGSNECLEVPVEQRSKRAPKQVQTAEMLSPEGWQDRVRVDTVAGYLSAICIRLLARAE